MPKGILDESIWSEPQVEETKKGIASKEEKREQKEKKEKLKEKEKMKEAEKKQEKVKEGQKKVEKKEAKEEKGKWKETEKQIGKKKEEKIERKEKKKIEEIKKGKEKKEKILGREVKAEKIDFSKTGRLSSLVFYPLISEKAVNVIESENKLSFIVRKEATKQDVKRLVEETFAVKVKSIKSLNDTQGRKKMIVRLGEGFKAREIATRLGVI